MDLGVISSLGAVTVWSIMIFKMKVKSKLPKIFLSVSILALIINLIY